MFEYRTLKMHSVVLNKSLSSMTSCFALQVTPVCLLIVAWNRLNAFSEILGYLLASWTFTMFHWYRCMKNQAESTIVVTKRIGTPKMR